MTLGVVSDTHGYFDPCLHEILAGVDAILHGGDVGAPEILDELRRIAPVYAVRGNVDSPESNLPPSLTLSFAWLQVEMMHILPVPQSELERWADLASPKGKPPQRSERFLKMFNESTGVVVFGHSHSPCLVNLDSILFFNPGSAGRKRFTLPRTCGLLEVFPDHLRATIKPLERYNGKLPASIRLEFEEEE
ncbi:MAG: metallophosphoesterase family protein [Terriglobia bacterium]